MLDDRRVYLVPPCNAEADGELSVLGVKQSRALGDALGEVSLMAVYAGPGLAAEQTAAAVAQRHGLVVRRKPGLLVEHGEAFTVAVERILEIYLGIARVGPGRTSLLVAELDAIRIMLDHCWGLGHSPTDELRLESGSITEIAVTPTGFIVDRLGDREHLPRS